MPLSSSGPYIVYDFPEPVYPYAKITTSCPAIKSFTKFLATTSYTSSCPSVTSSILSKL